MLGATTAGMAFSNASVALVHGMSRPIGAFFHVPHGLSNAMLLPEITAFSAPAALDRYADCARAMGVADESEGSQSAVARLVDELRRLNADLQVPSPRQYGIDRARYEELLPVMASQALASGLARQQPARAERGGDHRAVPAGVRLGRCEGQQRSPPVLPHSLAIVRRTEKRSVAGMGDFRRRYTTWAGILAVNWL